MPAVVSLGARAVVRLAWYPASLHLLPCTCANVLSNSLSIMVVPFCLHKRDNLVWYKLVWIPQGSHTVYLDNEWLRCNFLDKLLFLLVRISPCGQFKLFVEIILSHLCNCKSTGPGLNVSDQGMVTRSCLPSWWSCFSCKEHRRQSWCWKAAPAQTSSPCWQYRALVVPVLTAQAICKIHTAVAFRLYQCFCHPLPHCFSMLQDRALALCGMYTRSTVPEAKCIQPAQC